MLPDILEPGLDVVFVGSAKSVASYEAGHYYAHPQNGFWELLAETGLTGGERLEPSRDREVLRHGIGLTDLVAGRASSSDSSLTARDFDAPGFVVRMEWVAPRIVAFNSSRSAERVARQLGHPAPALGEAGWRVAGALVYRLPSSSSANQPRGGFEVKRRMWREFGSWAREALARGTRT